MSIGQKLVFGWEAAGRVPTWDEVVDAMADLQHGGNSISDTELARRCNVSLDQLQHAIGQAKDKIRQQHEASQPAPPRYVSDEVQIRIDSAAFQLKQRLDRARADGGTLRGQDDRVLAALVEKFRGDSR